MRPQSAKYYYTVALHDVDQAQGGYEEGGWWYSFGIPCSEPELKMYARTFKSKRAADRYCDWLFDHVVPQLNEGKLPLSSVACNGVVEAIVQRGNKPYEWPEEIPYYN